MVKAIKPVKPTSYTPKRALPQAFIMQLKANALAEHKETGVSIDVLVDKWARIGLEKAEAFEKRGEPLALDGVVYASKKTKATKAEAKTSKAKSKTAPVETKTTKTKTTKVKAETPAVTAEPKTTKAKVQPRVKSNNVSTKKPVVITDAARQNTIANVQKALGTDKISSLADARKNYETALKSGSMEDILDASKKLTEAQTSLNPAGKKTLPIMDLFAQKTSQAPKDLAGAEKAYKAAAATNNIDDMVAAQQKLNKARFDAGLDVFQPKTAGVGDIVDDAARNAGENITNNRGLWNSIKSHPWITSLVVLAAAAGVYLATRKDEATIEDAT